MQVKELSTLLQCTVHLIMIKYSKEVNIFDSYQVMTYTRFEVQSRAITQKIHMTKLSTLFEWIPHLILKNYSKFQVNTFFSYQVMT